MSYVLGKKFVDEGVWKKYQGAELCIAQSGNDKFSTVFERLKRPFRKKIGRDNLSDAKMKDLTTEAIAEAILIDWKGVVDEDGNKVPYTPEIGFQQLNNDTEMLEFVLDVASDNEEFRAGAKKKTVGKS